MGLSYEDRWEKVKELAAGGQGQVWLVRDKESYRRKPLLQHVMSAVSYLGPGAFGPGQRIEALETLRESVIDMVNSESPAHQGALKILHGPDKARDAKRATERFRR